MSCHYLIDQKGEILKMVDENKIAWHAGKSKWKNYINLNKNSIGIELVNKGHEIRYEKFSKAQINKLVKLCLILKKKYKIKSSNVVGHSDIAPLRKKDPGEKFPWKLLSKKKLGIWFYKNKKNLFFKNDLKTRNKFFNDLSKIGYNYFSANKNNINDKKVIKAFQMKFLQKNVTGKLDQKTYEIGHYLARKV